ncbi:hypothetical protein [Streptomyces chartreusis]|uniref:hypothetical protein n=1 Tax=Streptomyces chartreusis TaxID=1969 RepID=UPI00386FC44C|nr:hypothetical protein OG938_44265 [Streptomyces chartreusis]
MAVRSVPPCRAPPPLLLPGRPLDRPARRTHAPTHTTPRTLALAGADGATDVLDTTDDGRFRVRLVPDKEARNPRTDDTNLVHVITIDTYHGRNLPVDKNGGPLAAVWERLKWNRWKGVDTFTRYVAIMHGGIVLESAPPRAGPAPCGT